MCIRPLPSSKNSHFQNEAKCKTFLAKMSFICTRMKKDYHINSFALSLALKLRLEVTRKGPIYYLSFSLRQQQLSAVPDSVTSAGSQRVCSSGHVTELRSKPPEKRRVICIGNTMIFSDIWNKYHECYLEILLRNFTSR